MNPYKYLLNLAILLALGAASVAADRTRPPRKDLQALVQANNNFALALYEKLNKRPGNLFFSPYSISSALAMAYSGARGTTAEQMANVLRLPPEPSESPTGQAADRQNRRARLKPCSPERLARAFAQLQRTLQPNVHKKGYELHLANALWGQSGYEFLDAFLQIVEQGYRGRLSQVDFIGAPEKARQTINLWVERQTRNKIKDLIKPGVLNSLTRLVLTNAIYFKGRWENKFDNAATRSAPFTTADGQKVEVPMMNHTGDFRYMQTDNLQGLELPYVDNDLSMFIFLPRQADGIASLEQMLTPESLSRWLNKFAKRKVAVSIPKFKVTTQFSLASALRSMGMTDAFTPDSADFSGINGRRDLFISAVIHKAYVEVNEEGTEAAAATGVVIGVTSVAPARPVVFRADHPFLFLVRDNRTGSILFLARLANPAA